MRRRHVELILLLAVLVGCSASPADVSPPAQPVLSSTPVPTTAQQHLIVSMLETDDADPTMSREQRAILLETMKTGVVSFEQYQDAIVNTLVCAEDAGLMIDGPRTVDASGKPTIEWGWTDPTQEDGDPQLGERCRLVHSLGVEQAYLNDSSALEREREQINAYRPGIAACIEDNGVAIDDPSMDGQDLLRWAFDLDGPSAEAVKQCLLALDISVDP